MGDFLRWPTRQIQRSIAEHVRQGLTAGGWFDPDSQFAEHLPITWAEDHDPETVVAGGGPEKPNTVGVSVGDVPDYVLDELGPGLQSVSIPAFIDVYGENRSVALNIADDVVAILQGEFWTPSRFIPLYDWSTQPEPTLLTDRTIECRLVEARWPGQAAGQEWRRTWRMVAFTAQAWWTGQGHD